MPPLPRPMRSVVSSLVLLALALPAAADPGVERWRFRVYLDDLPVGYHSITVRHEGETLSVTSDARFSATVMSVPVYRYAHNSSERWSHGCLQALSAQTDENGRPRRVEAVADGDRVAVTSGRGEESLQGCVMTYAYWNPATLKATRLLNAQTGQYQPVRVTQLPDDPVRVKGRTVLAHRFRLDTGKHDIDLWYTSDGHWVALNTAVILGKHLRYVLE